MSKQCLKELSLVCVGLCDTVSGLFLIWGKFFFYTYLEPELLTQSLKGKEHHVAVCQRKHNVNVLI